MTAYVRASKAIGWDAQTVALPTFEEVGRLLDRGKAGDEGAFREIFRLYRFLGTQSTPQGAEVLTAVVEAWEELAPKFRGIP